jgi:hypothetical protein
MRHTSVPRSLPVLAHPAAMTAAIMAFASSSIALAGPPAAAGTELCVPQAEGVPGPQPKTPEWWNAAALGKEQRWTGATRTETPAISVGTPMAWTRTIWDQPTRTVFVHTAVRSDPTLNLDLDHVVLALTNAAGQPALYVQLDPMNGCIDPGGNGIIDACEGEGRAIPTGAGGGVKYAAPESVVSAENWTAVSVTNPAVDIVVERAWVQISRRVVAGGPVFDWDVQVAITIPVDGGGQAGANARVFSSALVHAGSAVGGNALQFPTFCNASSPVSLASCVVTGTTDDARADGIPGNLDRWEPLRTSQQCAGVSIDRALVGSDANTSTGILDGMAYVFPGNEIPRTTGARLRAGIRNTMGRTLNPGEVTAEFRIANWGAAYATWDQATWTRVGSASLVGSLAGIDTQPQGGVAFMAGQGSLGMAAPYVPGGTIAYDHQCVHVRLEGHPSAGQELRFANDSVYRNMDLVPASVFRRSAEISLVGLPEPEVPRRVLLLVDTRTMPGPGECWVMPKGDDVPTFTGVPGCWAENMQMPPLELADPEKRVPGVDTPDQLPTWAAHAFLESGETVDSDGVANPIWMPFSGFGYWVEHHGPVSGWEQRLHGATRPAGAPHNVYVIETPPNRIVTVATTIRAIDDTTAVCPAPGGVESPMEGCDEPSLPPPREVGPGPRPDPDRGCCASESRGQGTAHGIVMFGILFGLRRARRRDRSGG